MRQMASRAAMMQITTISATRPTEAATTHILILRRQRSSPGVGDIPMGWSSNDLGTGLAFLPMGGTPPLARAFPVKLTVTVFGLLALIL